MAVARASTKEKVGGHYNTCHACGATWKGQAASHCSSCHRTFANTKAFDDHQAGHKPRNGVGEYRPGGPCYDPADSGQTKSPEGLWSLPSTRSKK